MLTVQNYEKKHGMFGSMEKNEYLCHQDAHPATFLQERGFQEWKKSTTEQKAGLHRPLLERTPPAVSSNSGRCYNEQRPPCSCFPWGFSLFPLPKVPVSPGVSPCFPGRIHLVPRQFLPERHTETTESTDLSVPDLRGSSVSKAWQIRYKV